MPGTDLLRRYRLQLAVLKETTIEMLSYNKLLRSHMIKMLKRAKEVPSAIIHTIILKAGPCVSHFQQLRAN